MSSITAIALSGMNVAQTSLRVGAHNIANLGTTGFRREQVMQTANAAGGTSASVVQASVAGHSLESDLLGQLQAKNAFLANLAVFRTGDRMAGALLDVLS